MKGVYQRLKTIFAVTKVNMIQPMASDMFLFHDLEWMKMVDQPGGWPVDFFYQKSHVAVKHIQSAAIVNPVR